MLVAAASSPLAFRTHDIPLSADDIGAFIAPQPEHGRVGELESAHTPPTEDPSLDACEKRLNYYRSYFSAIFVHPPETGGAAVEAQLGVSGSQSCTADAFLAVDDQSFRDAATFASVRHPLPRLVSLYERALAGGGGGAREVEAFAPVKKRSFGDFVRQLDSLASESRALRLYLRPQAEYLTSARGVNATRARHAPGRSPAAAAGGGAGGFGAGLAGGSCDGCPPLVVDHLLSTAHLRTEWPLLRAMMPGLPALALDEPGDGTGEDEEEQRRWCERFLDDPDPMALQQAAYRYYRKDYELLRFAHPLPLHEACGGEQKARAR